MGALYRPGAGGAGKTDPRNSLLQRALPEDLLLLLRAEAAEFFAQLGAAVGQDGDGQQSRVARPRRSDGQGAYRNPGGHLNRGQERIQSLRSEEHTSELQ